MKMKKAPRRATLAALFVLAPAAHAGMELNMETIDETPSIEEEGVSGDVTLGFSQRKGNTDNSATNAEFKWTWHTGSPWVYDGRLFAMGKTEEGVTTDERYEAQAAAKYFLDDKSYLVGRLVGRKDRFGAIENEYLATLGYGRVLLRTEDHRLIGELGAGYRKAEDSAGEDEAGVLGVAGLQYDWALTDNSSFSQLLVWEESADNTVLRGLTEIKATLIGRLAAKGSFEVRRQSNVPAGDEKTDYYTLVGLEYAFGK